jgi:hypothetical protein
MTAAPPRPELRADDPLQKFQGRWVGIDGWEWPFHARYVAWGIWAVTFPLVLLGDWLLTRTVAPLPLIDLIISLGVTVVLANLTSGEISLGQALVYLTRSARIAVASFGRRLSSSRPRRTTYALRVRPRPEPACPLQKGVR